MTERRIRTLAMLAQPLVAALLAWLPAAAAAIEQPDYQVVRDDANLQLRRYPAYYIVATTAGADFESAGNTGFRTLFRYISGANASAEDIAMTAPVIQSRDASQWSLAFVVPANYAPDAIPAPSAEGVTVQAVPGGLYAATRFSGRWSEARFLEREVELLAGIDAAGLFVCGPTLFARYDPPFKPPFMRRNEVLVAVSEVPCATAASLTPQ